MAGFDKFTGINVASGFKLQAKESLDKRLTVDTIADRDALVTQNGAYEGMTVYVKADKTKYTLKGTTNSDWVKDDAASLAETIDGGDGAGLVKVNDWDDPDDNPSGSRYIALVNDRLSGGTIGAKVGAVDSITLTDDNKINADITGAAASVPWSGVTGKPTIDSSLSSTSTNAVQNKVINSALAGKVPTSRKVNNKALSADISLSAADVGAIPTSQKGAAGGVAELDSSGKVPSAQLPSYVDDTVEGYLSGGKFYKESAHTTQITGESGKIYVDLATNKTYRWSGSAFVEISASIALGETSSTAYRGDRGKVAYDHSQAAHAPSNAERNTIVGVKKNGVDVSPDSSRKVNIVTRDIYYGICSTALATAEKAATVTPSGFTLTDGATVQIRFDNGLNGNGDISLNINGTGSKYVSINGVDGFNLGYSGMLIDQKGTLTLTYWEQTDSYVVNGIDTAYWLSNVDESLQQLKESLNNDGASLVLSKDWTDPDDNPSGNRYIALVNDAAPNGIGASVGAVSNIALTDDNKITASITGSAASAAQLTTNRYIDGVSFNGTANISHYATCSTAAATVAKTVNCTGFSLSTGARITIKFTVTNTATSPTLNVNNTGAKSILYRGSAISAGYLAANRTYEFVYNGTAYELVGDVDTNTTYTNATTAKSGLMSTTDKSKLDSLPEIYFSSTEPQSATPNSIWYEVI